VDFYLSFFGRNFLYVLSRPNFVAAVSAYQILIDSYLIPSLLLSFRSLSVPTLIIVVFLAAFFIPVLLLVPDLQAILYQLLQVCSGLLDVQLKIKLVVLREEGLEFESSFLFV
jgi:hypothetical protein